MPGEGPYYDILLVESAITIKNVLLKDCTLLQVLRPELLQSMRPMLMCGSHMRRSAAVSRYSDMKPSQAEHQDLDSLV